MKATQSGSPRVRRSSPAVTSVLPSEMSRRIGAIQRTERVGPEMDLVASFLNGSIFAAPPRCEVSIFQEPRLPSGFPDLVIVFWRRDVVQDWVPARASLRTPDIRLAHYLCQIGPAMLPDLQASFGKNVSRCLERLHEAGIVKPKRDCWTVRSLSEVFAVKQLIAVEAKVNKWRAGLKQAWLNTWFASDSYLLVPQVPRGSALLDRARELVACRSVTFTTGVTSL